MFLASLLRRIAFSYYDYKANNFNIGKTDFVVIHIPDQIGDAMAIFPVIRAIEMHKIKYLLIVTSTINLEVFNALKLEQTKLTLVTMTTVSYTHLTAAIASGMGVAVLPESAARSLCGAVNGWMSRITTPSMSLSLSLNLPARANLSPQAQAVKELLMSVISSPVMEKRQWQLVS